MSLFLYLKEDWAKLAKHTYTVVSFSLSAIVKEVRVWFVQFRFMKRRTWIILF